MTFAVACFYVGVMFFFVIAVLVDWLRLRVPVRKYLKYGLTVGVMVAAAEAVMLLLGPGDSWMALRVWACGMDFLKMVGFTSLGMYYCYLMGRPSLPLFLRRFPVAEAPAVSSPPLVPEFVPLPPGSIEAPPGADGAPAPDEGIRTDRPRAAAEVVLPPVASAGTASEACRTLPREPVIPADSPPRDAGVTPPPIPDALPPLIGPAPAPSDALPASFAGPTAPVASRTADADILPPPAPHVDGHSAVFSALVVAGLGVLYSVVLFGLTAPRLSERLKRVFGTDSVESVETISLRVLVFVLLVALGEEIVFRLGVQNFLARYLRLRPGRYWIAIVITTALWTLGHAGTLEPGWVKPAQVFPLGLLLGWLCQRYGAESSILAHMAFNGAMLFLSPQLLT